VFHSESHNYFLSKSNLPRRNPEPKTNRFRTALKINILQRLKIEPKANQTRIKSRKILASACKFAGAKSENLNWGRIKRTKPCSFLEWIVDDRIPAAQYSIDPSKSACIIL